MKSLDRKDKLPSFQAMPRAIGFLIYPDFQLLDVTGPITAFELTERFSKTPYGLTILSQTGGLIRSSSGIPLPSTPITDAGPFHTLIISGGTGSRTASETPALLDFIKAHARTERRTCSICSGAFLLASAGLLNGRRATTHWQRSEELARNFPQIHVEPDAIYRKDNHLWTSAGITAGIDLTLALIAEDHSSTLARNVARQMVVYHHRPGGQSQFSALLEIAAAEGRFSALLGWARSNLTRPLTLEHLAEQASMSPRNFTRSFRQSVGMTPAKAIERLRLESAREQVENSSTPIELIATSTGFHDPERMRRAFLRTFGQPPLTMRRNALRTTS